MKFVRPFILPLQRVSQIHMKYFFGELLDKVQLHFVERINKENNDLAPLSQILLRFVGVILVIKCLIEPRPNLVAEKVNYAAAVREGVVVAMQEDRHIELRIFRCIQRMVDYEFVGHLESLVDDVIQHTFIYGGQAGKGVIDKG